MEVKHICPRTIMIRGVGEGRGVGRGVRGVRGGGTMEGFRWGV